VCHLTFVEIFLYKEKKNRYKQLFSTEIIICGTTVHNRTMTIINKNVKKILKNTLVYDIIYELKVAKRRSMKLPPKVLRVDMYQTRTRIQTV
jgi:hypothetical protein